MAYWLMKSEPETFSIDALQARARQTEAWDGVRNYQARNYMRDQMRPGDQAFFYHSNCAEPGIYGLMEIVSEGYPDPTQYDAGSKYYDPAATPEQPRWYLVDVRYQRHLRRPILLSELREHAPQLQGFKLLSKGSRLSVLPVHPEHWSYILGLERRAEPRAFQPPSVPRKRR